MEIESNNTIRGWMAFLMKPTTLLIALVILCPILLYFMLKWNPIDTLESTIHPNASWVIIHDEPAQDSSLNSLLKNSFPLSQASRFLQQHYIDKQQSGIVESIEWTKKLDLETICTKEKVSFYKKAHKDMDYYRISFTSNSLFIYPNRSTWIISDQEAILKNILDEINSDLLNDTNIEYATALKSKQDSPSRLLINIGKLKELFAFYGNEDAVRELNFLRSMKGWLVFNTKNNTHLSGEGILYSSNRRGLYKKLSIEPHERNTLFKILPYNTALATVYDISLVERLNNLASEVSAADIETFINPWFDNQVAIAKVNAESGIENVLYLKTKDREITQKSLKQYITKHGGKTEEIKGDVFYYLVANNLLHDFLDDKRFPTISNPYIYIDNGYVIVSRRKETIQQLLKEVRIDNHMDYNAFSIPTNIDFPNYSLYVNTSQILPWITQNKLPSKLDGISTWLSDFSNFQIDFNTVEAKAYFQLTNKQGKSNTQKINTAPVQAKYKIIHEGSLVASDEGNPLLIVQDEYLQLNALEEGKIVWQYGIDKPITSPVLSIKDKEEGDLITFNTSNEVYLMNSSGDDQEGFPLVFDIITGDLITYQSNLIVPVQNKIEIINTNSSNKRTINTGLNGDILSLKTFTLKKKSYIAGYTDKNEVFSFDFTGKAMFPAKQLNEQIKLTGDWGIDNHKKYGRIVLLDNKTKAHIVNFQGQSFGLLLAELAHSAPNFIYKNVTGDSRKDYILINGKSVAISRYEGIKFKKYSSFPLKGNVSEWNTRRIHGKNILEIITTDHQLYWYTFGGSLYSNEFPISAEAISGVSILSNKEVKLHTIHNAETNTTIISAK